MSNGNNINAGILQRRRKDHRRSTRGGCNDQMLIIYLAESPPHDLKTGMGIVPAGPFKINDFLLHQGLTYRRIRQKSIFNYFHPSVSQFILIVLSMKSKSKINIVSGIGQEFSSNLTIGDVIYHVQTEDMGTRTCKIISRVYLKGEVVMSRKTDYSHFVNAKDSVQKIKALMGSHHKASIDTFIKSMTEKEKTKADYFEDIKKLLQKRNK